MAYEHSARRYRNWYAKLIRFYPKPYRERFGKEMKQTFNDLLREHADEERGVFRGALWIFVETSAGIIKENINFITMQNITKRLSVWAVIVAAVLTIPLLAKAPWTGSDFVFGAVLLFGSATVYELATRTMSNKNQRIAVGVAVFMVLAIIWVAAATGFEGIID